MCSASQVELGPFVKLDPDWVPVIGPGSLCFTEPKVCLGLHPFEQEVLHLKNKPNITIIWGSSLM